MNELPSDIEAGYDSVAEEFVGEFFSELERKPFDRDLLDGFANSVRDLEGEVCDIGCGPGQIARYLRDRGVSMRGIDLSHEMVNQATRLNPDISFERGDMLSLNLPNASLAGIVCFYAIIHLKRKDVTRALQEMHRVIKPAGKIFVSFHRGKGELHRDEWYGKRVSIDVTLFQKDEMAGFLRAAGFEIKRMAEREAYEFEYPTQRLYAFGNKPLL